MVTDINIHSYTDSVDRACGWLRFEGGKAYRWTLHHASEASASIVFEHEGERLKGKRATLGPEKTRHGLAHARAAVLKHLIGDVA